MSDTTNTNSFQPFSKIARLSRECVVTEKIDGTNAQIFITDTIGEHTSGIPLTPVPADNGGAKGWIAAGSRNRWITPENDNYGFARWVKENAEELIKLGPGRHFGEYWGAGIQRRYGLTEKRFSLFNVARWVDRIGCQKVIDTNQEFCPECCHVVPVLYRGVFDSKTIEFVLDSLKEGGSEAAPGFMNPEGIVIYHTASKTLFKKTIKDDESPKSLTI